MKLKSAFFLFSLVLGPILSAQTIRSEVIQTQTSRGVERVILKVYYEGKSDSIKPMTYKGHKLKVENRSTSMSVVQGRTEFSGSVTFSFRPDKTGAYEFEGPIIYVDGEAQQGKPISFEVNDVIEREEMSELELAALEWPFALDDNTFRITMDAEHGVLEKRFGEEWRAVKNLDAETCKELIELLNRDK